MRELSRILMFLWIVGFMFSCQNEMDDKIKNNSVDTRIVFKSSKDFIETYYNLISMNDGELRDWVDKKNIASIFDCIEPIDSTILDRPKSFQAIFNDKLEFQINDSIIWYNDGKLYLLSTDNKQDLNERKNKVGSLPIFGTSELNVPEERESTNIITKGTCDYDSRGPSYKYIIPCTYKAGHQYRYVHEIFSHKFTTPYDVLVELYLGVKLHWRKNAEWKVTGSEYHNIDIDLSGSAQIDGGRTICSIEVHKTLNNVIGDQIFLLARWKAPNGPTKYWEFVIKGKIKQEVLGFPCNTFWDHWVNF